MARNRARDGEWRAFELKGAEYMTDQRAAAGRPVGRATTMLGADLENENSTIRAYRDRVRQCEALGEYATAEDLREIGSFLAQ